MTKAKIKSAPRVSKNVGKSRTSFWLDDGLRKMIDTQSQKDQRGLGFTLEALLRKGLGLAPKPATRRDAVKVKLDVKPNAPIFG